MEDPNTPRIGRGYIQDNTVFWDLQKQLNIDRTGWSYVSPSEASKDGRYACVSIN